MVGGTLYVNTAASVGAAYDARTGALKWIYNPKSYEAGTTTLTLRWNQRGVAYWRDGNDERIYWGTGDGYLIAVDAKTGRPIDSFGENGKVDLMEGLPRAKRGTRDYLNALTYSVQSPPIVVKDLVDHSGGDLVADQDQGTDPRMDSRVRRAHRQGALDLPDRCRRRASSAARRGRTARTSTPARSRCGRS